MSNARNKKALNTVKERDNDNARGKIALNTVKGRDSGTGQV